MFVNCFYNVEQEEPRRRGRWGRRGRRGGAGGASGVVGAGGVEGCGGAGGGLFVSQREVLMAKVPQMTE